MRNPTGCDIDVLSIAGLAALKLAKNLPYSEIAWELLNQPSTRYFVTFWEWDLEGDLDSRG